MKATELQINDWVYSSFFGETKVTSLKEYEEYGWVITSGCDNWKSDASLSPIPLTAEILEKNGWKEAQFWHEYQDGKNTIQSCLPDMRGIINGVEIQHFKCEYVHQYQHLLRLCGLDDLADNFKI